MSNLLRNPGFEADWSEEKSHKVRVFPVGGIPYETEKGNVFNPPFWTCWFRHLPGTWDEPEVKDAWATLDPRRVHSGKKSIAFFTFYRNHDGGFYQKVEVVPENTYTASSWCTSWSNHDKDGFPHPDDPYWSDGTLVGYGVVSYMESQLPPINGNPQNDANWNMKFMIGLDPNGGDSPFDASVVWSDPRWKYNSYTTKLPPVEVKATGNVMTVWLRSTTKYPFKHNDVNWDDASLEGSEPPPIREYERTAVLLPNNDPFIPSEQARIAALNPGKTITPSADDAAITHPYLKKRTVISYQPQTWGGIAALENFWEEFYTLPDEIEYREVESSYLLAQCDKRWANDPFGER